MKKLYVLTLLILILNPVTAFAASSSWDVMIWDEDVWYPDNFTMITSGEVTLTETTQGTSVKFSIRPAIEPVQTPLKVSIVNTCESKVMIVSSNELVFDQTNWEKEQYFELKSSFDDESLIDEQDCTIQIYVKGDTQPYDHLKDLVIPVHIVDNDRIGLKISDKPLSVTENGNLATYTVCLMSKPSSSVTLTTFLEQVTVSPPKLILTPSNYNIPQMITITAIDDKKFEQDHDGKITHELESEDSHYNNFLSELQVSIIDNDRAEISSNMPINIGEAGPSAQLKLQLTSMPDDDVTINLMTSDQISLTLSTLTFKSLDWNKPQLIGVSAINDNIDEGNDYTTTII